MASHLALLHLSHHQASPVTVSNTTPMSFPPKSVAKGPQIVLDLSQCRPESIQKPFAKIRQLFHTSITGNPGIEGINIKGMNKDAKREYRYFVFFNTPEDE